MTVRVLKPRSEIKITTVDILHTIKQENSNTHREIPHNALYTPLQNANLNTNPQSIGSNNGLTSSTAEES